MGINDEFKRDYNDLQKLCKKVGAYCPPSDEVMREWANCPLWLRLFLRVRNERKLLDLKNAKVLKI